MEGKERSTREEKIHRKLRVWEHSIELVVDTYRVIKGFPKDERYILGEQIRRAVISIPANIAEGAARTTAREKLQFWSFARASLSELDTELEIALRLGYLDKTTWAKLSDLMDAVGRMLSGLMRTKRQNP
jgi:four helix bundle protein